MRQILPYFWFFIFTQSIVCMPFDMPDQEIEEPGDWETDQEIDDLRDQETDVEYGDRFEGDMDLTDEQLAAIFGDRNVIVEENYRWSNNKVPYVLSENHTTEQIDAILFAMQEIEKISCVRFQKRSDETDYVKFEANDDGCYSSVGRRGGKQILNLKKSEKGQGCFVVGRIIHALLHTLGFYHMQNAPDRDDYVTINWDNIEANKTHNFRKYNSSIVEHFNITYDFESIMHCSSEAFTKYPGIKTIVPRDGGDVGLFMGQRDDFSLKDILKLKAMYKCEMSTIKPRFNANGRLFEIFVTYFRNILNG